MKHLDGTARKRKLTKLTGALQPRRSLIVAVPLALAAAIPGSPAFAACLQSGNTVTCSGASVTGFGTGLENNLTVTVQPDASISVGAAQTAINLGSGNTAINNGAIVVGNNSFGMRGVGDNVLTNAGTMNSAALNTFGIDLLGIGNTVTNSGTITLTGTASFGVFANGIGHTIQNSGVITVGGSSGTGVAMLISNKLVNTGTITAGGANGVAVSLLGDGNTVTNGGTISASGSSGVAINIGGINNTIVNNGTVKGGANGHSLRSAPFTVGINNTITNNGTLDGAIAVFGTGNSLTNAGLITITDPGTALAQGLFFGTFTQMAQGTLAPRVDNAGHRDGLFASELVKLGGTLRPVLLPGLYQSSTTYTNVVQSFTAVTGQFASVTSPSAFFNATATYNAKSVDLTLTRQGFGAVAGETLNQRAVGNALEAGYSTALTGAAAAFYSQLLQEGSVRLFDQFSGEGTSGTQNTAFSAGSLFGQTMDSQMEAWHAGNRGGVNDGAALGFATERSRGAASAFNAVLKAPAMAQPQRNAQWNAWASGFGAGQQLSGNANVGSASFNDRAAGGAMGVDHLVNPDLLLGIAAGGSSATFSVNDRATSGRLEGGHVGAYAMQRFGASYLSAQIAYSHFNNTTTRTIAGVGPTETAQGSFASDQLAGRLEIGRAFQSGAVSVTPFAAVQAARLWQAAYTESSTAGGTPGVLGLSYAAHTASSLPVFVGVKLDSRTDFGNGVVLTPFVHAAWVHEFEPSRTITASLTTLPVPAFTVAGASAASDAARLDLGSRLALNRWWEVSGRVTGEFSSLGQSYSGMGAVRASW